MAGAVLLTDEQWERASRAQGWYDRDEADLLYRLTDGPWCEVGCWKGRSTSVLAQTGFPGWAVDWFKGSSEHGDVDTYHDFAAHMVGFDHVAVLRMAGDEAATFVPDGLSLLHLDAEHSYEATAAMFGLYAPKVGRAGHVVLHDAFTPGGREVEGSPWPGVTRFALELEQGDGWALVEHVNRSAAFRRI